MAECCLIGVGGYYQSRNFYYFQHPVLKLIVDLVVKKNATLIMFYASLMETYFSVPASFAVLAEER